MLNLGMMIMVVMKNGVIGMIIVDGIISIPMIAIEGFLVINESICAE
jgi:hypothetical protein